MATEPEARAALAEAFTAQLKALAKGDPTAFGKTIGGFIGPKGVAALGKLSAQLTVATARSLVQAGLKGKDLANALLKAEGEIAAAEATAVKGLGNSAPAAKVLDAVEGRAVSGQSGFLRSTPLTRREQLLLRDELKDLGVTVERGADKVLDKIDPIYAAAFNNKTGTIYLRQAVTDYEAFHEVTHARQWAALGRDKYLAQGQYAREKHVFDEIMKNEGRFTKDEIKHAKDYIADLKARFDAGLID